MAGQLHYCRPIRASALQGRDERPPEIVWTERLHASLFSPLLKDRPHRLGGEVVESHPFAFANSAEQRAGRPGVLTTPPQSCSCVYSSMHRRVYVWVLWLILAANALSVAASLHLAAEVRSRVPTLEFTSTPPRPGTRDWLFTEPPAVSPAMGLRYAHQSKQPLLLARSVSLVPFVQEHTRPPQTVLVPAFSRWRFFYPRKLSPPSADDDPSLS